MAKIKEEDLKEFTEKTSQIAYKAIEECNKAIDIVREPNV